MHWYRKVAVSSIVESLIFSAVSAAIALAGLAAWQVPFLDGYGFVLLIISSGLMLVGGALSFTTPGTARVITALSGRKLNPSPEDFVNAQHKAALYATTGVILFIESLALAVVTL
jgi:hypothetical protein